MIRATNVTTAAMRSSGVSPGGRSDLREASLGDVEVPSGINVRVGSSDCAQAPPGFVDVYRDLVPLPLCFRPSGRPIFLRAHSEEHQAVQSASGALHWADLTDKVVARAFVTGESRETFDALVTLVKCRLLDVRRKSMETAPSAAGAQMSLLHQMAQFGEEPPAAQQGGGISLTKRFQALRDVGVDLDCLEETASGNLSPLHTAVLGDKGPVVKALLENGANANLPTEGGATPLMLAAEQLKFEAMRELLTSRKADPNLRGYTTKFLRDAVAPLHLAVSNPGALAGVKMLLARGAKVMLQTQGHGWTPFRGHGWTPFHCAVRSGQFENAEALRKGGADPNVTDHEGNSALHSACIRKDGEAIKRLLEEFGADPNLPNGANQMPLYLAVLNFNGLGVIEKLLERGARVDADNLVTRNDQVCIFRSVLHLVCDIELRELPLGHGFEYLERVGRLLLKGGADPNQPDVETGDTPLHAAARRENLPMVQLLVEFGANIDLRNKAKMRPIDLAVEFVHPSIFVYLKDQGAQDPPDFSPKESHGAGGGA